MLGFIVGLPVFLTILACCIEYGNPDFYIQKKHNKDFIDDVVYELEQLL